MKKRYCLFRYHLASITLAAFMSASAQIELGYDSRPDFGWGDANSVVTPYVSFSEQYAGIYTGNAIISVSIAVMEEASNVYIYIKNRPDDQKYIYRQKVEKLSPGWNEIMLDEPLSITEASPVSIGYKASFAKAKGVAVSEVKYSDADYVYYNSQNRWTTTGGSICIKATIDGDNLPTDRLMLFPIKAYVHDNMVSIQGEARNVGDNDIESCSIQLSVDGSAVEVLSGEGLMKGKQDTYFFDYECKDYGEHTFTVQTTEINGKPAESDAINSVSATVTVKPSTYQFSRRIVCEEYTGTWCGFCPRGMVGLEMMREKYGEHFIPIAVHGYDPMQIEDEADSYDAFIEMISGAPSCKVNRQYGGDPYYDIQSLFDLASNMPLDLAVDLECSWNEDATAIEAITTYLSGEGVENPKYNIVYTITESGITGYPQTNYYSEGLKGNLPGWEEKSDPTFDVVYNDVARAVIGGYYGLECRYESMEAMIPYIHSISIPLPSNVTNPDNIKLIAQIVDTSSGRILNAAEATPATMGVGEVSSKISDAMISVQPGSFSVKYPCKEGCRVRAFSIDGRLLLDTPCSDGESFCMPEGILIVEVSDATGILKRKKIKI